MQPKRFLFLILAIITFSCKKREVSQVNNLEKKTELDTTKLYTKIGITYRDKDEILEYHEAYVSKKKDTFVNQSKFYNKGVLDSSKSTFLDFKLEGLKKDTIFRGRISFFSPADSIPLDRVESRDVTFTYLQKINDSLKFKKINTDKNVIEFDYKDYGGFEFVGFISDFRVIKTDSLDNEGKVLINRNYFAIDSEITTNNPFVDMLK